ncbi:MAG: cation:proton antiporter, partial [bacterium]
VQDIVVVVSLTLVGALGGDAAVESAGVAAHAAEGGGGAGGEAGGLLLPFLALAGLCLVAWAAAQTVLPRLFRWISRTADALFVWSITWCMLFVVASELVHLPLEIGAFLAGVALAQLPEAHPLARRLGPLTNFFLAIFFVALGIQMDPAAAGSQIGVVATLVVFVLAGKSVLLLWILGRTGEDAETAFRTGLAMAQVSEFSFVLAALAAQAGYLDEVALSVIGVVGLVTIAGSSLLLVRRDELYVRFRQSPFLRIVGSRGDEPPGPGRRVRDGAGAAEPGAPHTGSAHAAEAGTAEAAIRDFAEAESQGREVSLDSHVIVVGMNTLGRALVERLTREGHEVLAVDRDPEKLAGLPTLTLAGDVERLDVLEEANLAGARLLVSALQIEDTNKLLAHQAQKAGVPSSIHAFNPSVEEELAAAGASHLMDPKHEGARRFASHLRELGVLGVAPEDEAGRPA